jgi:hypothetical protein
VKGPPESQLLQVRSDLPHIRALGQIAVLVVFGQASFVDAVEIDRLGYLSVQGIKLVCCCVVSRIGNGRSVTHVVVGKCRRLQADRWLALNLIDRSGPVVVDIAN